jgi:molybdenum cofactor cytidylyltransferase
VIEVTVATLRDGGLWPIVVVLEPGSPCAALPGLQRDVLLVTNPDPARGMLSSIREGLAALPAAVEAVAVQPGDHAFLPPAAVRALCACFARVGPALIVPRYPEGRGHPLLVPRALFAAAGACDDAIGLRQLVARCAAQLVELPLDLAGADADIDRPADLSRLR